MGTVPHRFFEPMPTPYSDTFTVRVPGSTPQQGRDFLASVNGGSLLGAGRAASVDFVKLRSSYQAHAKGLQQELNTMRAAGATEEQIAQKVVAERTAFARLTRLRQGPGATVVLEIRDQVKYGLGGRSYTNLAKRADDAIAAGKTYTQGLSREQILIEGSMRPQELMNTRFLNAAKYLKYGGPVMLVLGAGISAHEIASAPAADRERVAMEQAGGFAAGELAAEGAAIALLTVGTGGLGLVAIVGIAAVGVAGGVAGSWIADKIYYARHPKVVQKAQQTGYVHQSDIHHFLPRF